jgi:ATP-dependent DNA helicase RecG
MSMNSMTRELIDQDESSTVERIASPDNRKEIAKAIVAFLNAKGGTIIVGLDENKEPAKCITNQHAKKLEKFLRSTVTPAILFSVSVDETDYGKVIVIEVPKGSDRPYVFEGAIYVRQGTGVKAAVAEQIRKMVEEDTDQPRWERRIATGLVLGDLDSKLIKRTVTSAIEVRGMTFSKSKDYASVLNEMAMMQFGDLTNAADVSFGTRISGRHPQTRVRAVCYETDRGGDHFIDDQLFEGPALKIYEDAMAFFRRNVSVANTFHPGQSRRESKPDYPFKSLREGLINALAHRDYSSYSGSVSLGIYRDRIEIWNTGKLAVSPQKLAQAKHESILVNPDISHIFYMNDLMERVGRGTYNIVRECEAFKMRPPKWQNVSAGVQLTLYAASSVVSAADELSGRVLALARSLEFGQTISLAEYVDQSSDQRLSDRQARRDLKQLTQLGLLERYGAARATRYKRTEVELP